MTLPSVHHPAANTSTPLSSACAMSSPDTPPVPGTPLHSAATMPRPPSVQDAAHVVPAVNSSPPTGTQNTNVAQDPNIPRFQILVDPAFSHGSEYEDEEQVIARLEDHKTEVNVRVTI